MARGNWKAMMVAALLTGCSPYVDHGDDSVEVPVPTVMDLSSYSAAVGDQLEIFGTDFVNSEDGWVEVTFEGTFQPDDGSSPEPVSITIPMSSDVPGRLDWDRFGAYRVPFSSTGDKAGTFSGQVYATNHLYGGGEAAQAADSRLAINFSVLPSIVVLDFRAVSDSFIADCKDPAPQALHAVPYLFRVKAIGFEAYQFEYAISEGLIVDGVATTSTSRFEYALAPGEDEHAVRTQWAPLPEYSDGYRASIHVRATGADGITRELMYPFTVRRPMQVYFKGPMRIAQLYQPEPVSGCIPGGPSSVQTAYGEREEQTISRSSELTVERGFEQGYGQQHEAAYGTETGIGGSESSSSDITVSDATTSGHDESRTNTNTIADGRANITRVTFESTDAEEYGWRVEDETVHDLLGNDGETRIEGSDGGFVFSTGRRSMQKDATRGWIEGERHTDVTSGETTESDTVGSERDVEASHDEARSNAYQSGSNWGVTNTYQEANGFNVQQNWNQAESFQNAYGQSQNISSRIAEASTEIYTVSSTSAQSLDVNAWVWAGKFGMWYRQMTRFVREGNVVVYDLCGNGTDVGAVVIDDYDWAPDLGIGDECPPPTNHPTAECRIPPCSGR